MPGRGPPPRLSYRRTRLTPTEWRSGAASMVPVTGTRGRAFMARKYSKYAGRKVEKTMHEMKRGKLRSGRSGKKVKSRKQAIAIGLSEARRAGKKVPRKKAAKRSKRAKRKSS